jgi:endo-1,3-1,4-beta-glycanase ExoK
MSKSIVLSFVLFLLIVVSISVSPNIVHGEPSKLVWCGQEWSVRSDVGDPCNNNWGASDSAWVDENNKLHLTIKKVGDTWCSTEVDSISKNFKYGVYKWTVDSPIMNYDPNVVVGMFYWLDDSHEIDIESTQWGDTGCDRLWYTVQPFSVSGNLHSTIASNSAYAKATNMIYKFDWQPTYVHFTSMLADGTLISDWNYTNREYIPQSTSGIAMNLYLMDDLPPTNGKNVEMVLSNFKYTPVTPPVAKVTKPIASFKADKISGAYPITVIFTDTSTGTPTAWKWNFGDGTSSTSKNPTHTYVKTNTYTVSLTARNGVGSNTVTKSKYITATAPPVKLISSFTAKKVSGTHPLIVIFTDKSTGSPKSWKWSFGDGNISTVQSPSHKYTKKGTYTVSLTVKNADGSSSITKSRYITVE